MKNLISLTVLGLISFNVFSANEVKTSQKENLKRAKATFKSIEASYSVKGTELRRETYPFDASYKASYLDSKEQASKPNEYAFLWPYSGMFTAVNTLYESSGDKSYLKKLDKNILRGLEKYWDCTRQPCGYSSYINGAPTSDRFYDDNVWIGIDFTDAYMTTRKVEYLEKAKLVWEFIESGTDDLLGGGIYWCEQNKTSKHTCSNAPGAVYALKLFQATADSSYFYKGKKLYDWTKENLQDKTDYLYFDCIRPGGDIDKAKYAYNSGQMVQAAALLYSLTNNEVYLLEAEKVAESCYLHFFNEFEAPSGDKFRLLRKGNVWFSSVMFRGFIELYKVNGDTRYIRDFQKNLDYAWYNSRNEKGLFNVDWSGREKDDSKWLLTQAAMVEMYARIAELKF